MLDRLLKNLSGDQTVSVIRAFSYFSHLANIAEDRHHVRRRAHHDREGHLQEGSLAMCFERLHAAEEAVRVDEAGEGLVQVVPGHPMAAGPAERGRGRGAAAAQGLEQRRAARDAKPGVTAPGRTVG